MTTGNFGKEPKNEMQIQQGYTDNLALHNMQQWKHL